MEIVLSVLIVLLIFILIYKHVNKPSYFVEDTNPYSVRKDLFLLNPDTNAKSTITLGETYTYPTPGILNLTGASKPFFTYNMNDNRCIKNPTNRYLDNPGGMTGIYNYTVDPATTEYVSCAVDYESRYSTATGRYIRIERINNSVEPYVIGHISVHGRKFTDPPYGAAGTTGMAFVYVNSVYKDPVTNIVNYPTNILNSPPGSSGTYVNTFTTSTAANSGSQYILIDLGQNVTIGYIEIFDNTGNSMNNCRIMVLTPLDTINVNSGSTNITVVNTAKPVYSYKIENSMLNKATLRRIYTQSVSSEPLTSLRASYNVYEVNTYPGCTGCVTNYSCTGALCLVKGHVYNTIDGRCFRAIDYGINSTLLDAAVARSSTLPVSDYTKYFVTCNSLSNAAYSTSGTLNSMITSPTGRYVRIQTAAPNITLMIYKFEARTKINGIDKFLIPNDVHVKPYEPSQEPNYRRLYTTDSLQIPVLEYPGYIYSGRDAAINSYIQLDVGNLSNPADPNVSITSIFVQGNKTSPSDADHINLLNSILSIIKDNGDVTYQVKLSDITTASGLMS